MGKTFYSHDTLKKYDSHELGELGREYYKIMTQTGHGKNPETRTDEQKGLIDKVVKSMLPFLEFGAHSLMNKGYFRVPNFPIAFTLRGLNPRGIHDFDLSPVDVAHQGALKIIEKFAEYEPRNTRGGLFSFAMYWAGAEMANYILKNTPNGKAAQRRSVQRRKSNQDNHLESLPHNSTISLSDLVYDREEGFRNTSLEREYLSLKPSQEDETFNAEISSQINKILQSLETREKTIIEKRFGLNGNVQMSLDDLGKIFGISKERIRQIESRALRKMRHRAPKDFRLTL
jgi:RNA polymerase sigma factor (sigma-70 family)